MDFPIRRPHPFRSQETRDVVVALPRLGLDVVEEESAAARGGEFGQVAPQHRAALPVDGQRGLRQNDQVRPLGRGLPRLLDHGDVVRRPALFEQPRLLRNVRLEERDEDRVSRAFRGPREQERPGGADDERENAGENERAAAPPDGGRGQEGGDGHDEETHSVNTPEDRRLDPERMAVERGSGHVPRKAAVDVRPGVLRGEPQEREDDEAPSRTRGRDRDRCPRDQRGPLGEEHREQENGKDAHRPRLAAEPRDDVEDPRDRQAPVRQAEQDPGHEAACALFLGRERRDPGHERERCQERQLERRKCEREQGSGEDTRDERPPAWSPCCHPERSERSRRITRDSSALRASE